MYTPTQALEAIKARINGEGDNPELLKLGVLSSDEFTDIKRIVTQQARTEAVTLGLSVRVAVIECEIAECNRTAKAIIEAANVKFGEQLTGVNKEAWDKQCALHKQLKQCLTLADGYIKKAEHLIK